MVVENAQLRGWGPGWPNCQYDKWRTLVRSDGVKVPLRVEILELTAYLLDETERLGYNLIPGWCWGAACRAIRGSSEPSNHSWGLAVDLNAPENPLGGTHGKIREHPDVIALWERFGFRWGGRYSGRKDDMHFEFMGTPAEAKIYTERARHEFGQKEWDAMASEAQIKAAAKAGAEAAVAELRVYIDGELDKRIGNPYVAGQTVLKALIRQNAEGEYNEEVKLTYELLVKIAAKLDVKVDDE